MIPDRQQKSVTDIEAALEQLAAQYADLLQQPDIRQGVLRILTGGLRSHLILRHVHEFLSNAAAVERGRQSRDETSLECLSPRARGLLADLMGPMRSKKAGQIYYLPNCTRHWYLAHQSFPGMRGRCELTIDQMIVLNCAVREALEYLDITPEWIRQRLAGRSPSDVADPQVDQE